MRITVPSRLSRQVGRYAHAHQLKLMHKVLRRLKGFPGRVLCDIERQLDNIAESTWSIAELRQRRYAFEPMIGHMKNDGRLTKFTLKGAYGDAIFAVLCGCGHNIRIMLNRLWVALCRLVGPLSLFEQLARALKALDEAAQILAAPTWARCPCRPMYVSYRHSYVCR